MPNLLEQVARYKCTKCHRVFKYKSRLESHTCCHCDYCGRTFYHPKKFATHVCKDTVECSICHRLMPVITNTHLKKHGVTPEQYSGVYGCKLKAPWVLRGHSEWMRANNPNSLPGVREKQIANNAMKNPVHKETQRLAVNNPLGQLQRHIARKKRSIDFRYTSYPERWLADHLEVPNENRRLWIYGAGEVDLAFPELKVAIEVQGCYWHGCLACGYTQPGNKGQRERDSIKASKLKALGWILLTIWEHEINPYIGRGSKCA